MICHGGSSRVFLNRQAELFKGSFFIIETAAPIRFNTPLWAVTPGFLTVFVNFSEIELESLRFCKKNVIIGLCFAILKARMKSFCLVFNIRNNNILRLV
jgi:hypothetical protein